MDPGFAFAADPRGSTTPPPAAGRYDKVILPGQTAPRLTVADKFLMNVKDSVSPFAAVGWVVGAGYEQVTNGTPNYGQTGKGFAQRLGAAAARDTSAEVFGYSVIAPILHEDPRYYKMGYGNSFLKRLVYSGTRAIFTRTDGGRQTINFAELGGDFSAALLTPTYYPQLNRAFSEQLITFGGLVGGSALGYAVDEFLSDALVIAHIKPGPR